MSPNARAPSTTVPRFFLITFAITWPCFIAVGRLAGHDAAIARGLLLYLGIFAPAFVAIGLTYWESGSEGVAALLRPLFRWNVAARWYVFALGYMAVVKMTVALLHRSLTGAWPLFGSEPWYVIVAATFASTLIGGQSGEEIGWRGFALPRLATRFGYGVASLILGALWALWHLPLFFVPGADTEGQSFIVYAVQVVAISVAIAWLYVRSGGSLLLTMLMHSAINQSKGIVPSPTPGASDVFTPHASLVAWLTASLLAGFAAILFLFGRWWRADRR